MACTIERPDPQAAWERISSQFSATVLGGAPIIPESNEFYAVSLEFALQEEFFAFGEQMWRERDPRYACCENLVDMAGKRGFYPMPATFAQGYVKLTGTAGAALNQNIRIQFGAQIFEPVSLVPEQMPSQGELVIRVGAVDPGTVGNINVTTGQILTPIPGVSSIVNSFGGTFCGGAEAEDCEQFRSRYLERLQYQPRLTVEWLRNKVAEWPCVTDVFDLGPNCCPVEIIGDTATCPNNTEFYVMFRNTFECGLAPQCVVDEITEWMFGSPQGLGLGQAEFGICGNIRTATPVKVDIFLNGLSCATPQQARVVVERIEDFVTRLPPATNLTIDQLRFIGIQVLGPTAQFDVTIRSDETQVGLGFNYCGDAIVECDYKLCINEILTPTNNVTASGCR